MTEKLLTELTESFDLNFAEIKTKISKAAAKSGRSYSDIILLAAVKTVSPELINYAVKSGIEYIGDNRVQEMLSKEDCVTEEVHKHFIGHLQTNKVKDVIDRVEMIESVHSLKLANTISRVAIEKKKCMDILLEVNIGKEESKSGFFEEDIYTAIDEISKLDGVKVKGLMCIPPVCESKEQEKEYFEKMYKLFIDIRHKNIDNISMEFLSMGMSDTYELAIECGANIVRLGTLLFGKRIYK